MRRAVLGSIFAAMMTAVPAAPALAQSGTASPAFHPDRASVALVGIPFGIFSAEYEHAVAGGVSFGGAVGHFESIGDDDGDTDDQSWLDAKVRYFPGERGLRGFAVGGQVGIVRVNGERFGACEITCEYDVRTSTGAAVGVFIDYSWLLGRSRRFYVGTGLGAKRVIGITDDGYDFPEILSASRLQIGYAF